MEGWRDGNVVLNLDHVFYAEKADDTNIRVHLREKRTVYLRYKTEAERDEWFNHLESAMQDDLESAAMMQELGMYD